jgi:pantothenate synthetase
MTDNNLISLSSALSALQKAVAQTTQSTAEFADTMRQFASASERFQDVEAIDSAELSKYKTLNPQHEIL